MPYPSSRDEIRSGRSLIGMFSILGSSEVVEMVGLAGFDFVIIDLEHGPYGLHAAASLILAARARALTPWVRVRSNDPSLVGAALDAGAAGVLVPQVGSVDAARSLVAAARFAPEGRRGLNPWVRAADFSAGADWLHEANESVAVMAMVEGEEGLANLGGILEVEGLDAIFLGPVDLAQSMGLGLQSEHPRVVDSIVAVVEQAARVGKAVAVFAPHAAAARRWIERGVRLVAVSEDTAVMAAALRGLRADIGSALPPVGS